MSYIRIIETFLKQFNQKGISVILLHKKDINNRFKKCHLSGFLHYYYSNFIDSSENRSPINQQQPYNNTNVLSIKQVICIEFVGCVLDKTILNTGCMLLGVPENSWVDPEWTMGVSDSSHLISAQPC